jgi:hypothetical protein
VSWLGHGVDVDEFIDLFQGARLLKNLVSSKTDTLIQDYNSVFDNLLQEFRDKAAGDTLVVVHRIWEDLAPKVDDLRESSPKDPLSNLPDI